jgi:hypothetical protein
MQVMRKAKVGKRSLNWRRMYGTPDAVSNWEAVFDFKAAI